MVTGIIARKLGMTQVFAPDGTVTPATLVKAGPCVVLQAKAAQSDGYEAVQLGFVEEKPAKVNKALGGHYKKAGNVPPTRVRREVKLAKGAGDEAPLKAGDQVLVTGVFNDGDRIDVIGISRGKGFQGVMKRHNFAGGAATHGSMFHRAPGSIGASSFPSRVVKGMRAAGRMGGDQRDDAQPEDRQGRRREQRADHPRRRAGRPGHLPDRAQGDRREEGTRRPGREGRQGDRREEARRREEGQEVAP